MCCFFLKFNYHDDFLEGSNGMALKKYGETDFITGIRGIAVMMVFLIHALRQEIVDTNSYLYGLINSGKFGVQIFFVISGFTIFYQFFSAGYNFKNFIKVRLVRLGVAYYPVLLFVFITINLNLAEPNSWAIKFTDGEISIENLFMHITYLGFLDKSYIATMLGVEWTLYVEVFFYFTLGLVISSGLWKVERNNWLILTIFLSVNAILFLLLKSNFIDSLLVHWMPFRHGLLFLMGGIAYTYRYHKPTSKCASQFVFILFLSQFLLSPLIKSTIVNEFMFAITTMLLLAFGNTHTYLIRLLLSKSIQFLGGISFSMYLLHVIVLSYIPDLFFISLISTLLLSYLYCNFFEIKLYRKIKAKILQG